MNNHDWNESFYQSLAENFGFKVNAIPFELLARSLPVSVLRKHKNNLFQLEALLFGQAGMLKARYRNSYFVNLKKEYKFLAGKYQLVAIEGHLWRFMRMRPANFPTLRISQFAALLHRSSFLFSQILETDSLGILKDKFRMEASEYWDDHYSFSSRSRKQVKKIGENSVQLLLINTIIPYLYVYGKVKNRGDFPERALKFLEQLPGESNSAIRGWENLGMPVRSAYNTQALIELRYRYCRRLRCLECGIGNSIIKGCGT